MQHYLYFLDRDCVDYTGNWLFCRLCSLVCLCVCVTSSCVSLLITCPTLKCLTCVSLCLPTLCISCVYFLPVHLVSFWQAFQSFSGVFSFLVCIFLASNSFSPMVPLLCVWPSPAFLDLALALEFCYLSLSVCLCSDSSYVWPDPPALPFWYFCLLTYHPCTNPRNKGLLLLLLICLLSCNCVHLPSLTKTVFLFVCFAVNYCSSCRTALITRQKNDFISVLLNAPSLGNYSIITGIMILKQCLEYILKCWFVIWLLIV